jgi:dynein light chain 1, axonemal
MRGGTSCKQAIANWEEKNGKKAEDEEVVKLYAQLPPIEKMDDSLNTLKACKHLSLSTNAVDRITALSLKNLEILSLSRNLIKRIMGLEEIGGTLKELWLSYNLIEKLDGFQPCTKLEVLYLGNNKIKSWDEVSKLSSVTTLKDLLLLGNPIYGDPPKCYDNTVINAMKPQVVKKVPQLQILDGQMITDTVRNEAEELAE